MSIRLVNLDGIDENGCIMISAYKADSSVNYIGLGLLCEKEYYSDSTRSTQFGAIEEGRDGIVQKIKAYDFESINSSGKHRLDEVFVGKQQFCCLGRCCNIHLSLEHRLIGAMDDSLKDCYESVYYPKMVDLVNEINANPERIHNTTGLYGEIFFWMTVENFNLTFDENDLIKIKFKFDDLTEVSDSIRVKI